MRSPLYIEIAERIELDIKERELSPGTRLLSERDLAEKFHVSRNVVREAIRLLSARGVLEPKKGQGAYVANPSSRLMEILQVMLVNNQQSFLQNLEVREVLEKAIIAKAVPCLNEDKLQKLRKTYTKMDGVKYAKSPEDFIRFDIGFHEQIAKCIPNPLFHLLLKTFYSMSDIDSFLVTKSSQNLFENAQAEHARILRAMELGDADLAIRELEAHMETVRRDLMTLRKSAKPGKPNVKK